MAPLTADPTSCCFPKVLVWNPYWWAKDQCGERPACPGCGNNLTFNGHHQKRMLMHSMESTWCVGPRFKCETAGCSSIKPGSHSRTWFAWDDEIRNGLPVGIQHMFPFQVEHMAIVECKAIDELVTMVIDGLSVSSFKTMMRERAITCALAIEEARKTRLLAAKSANQSPFCDNPNVVLQDFLAIDDPMGFDMWIPGNNFWHRLLKQQLEMRVGFWGRQIQRTDGLILKGDHSRKTAKLIRIKGVRIFKAVYTLMNEHGQVMMGPSTLNP